MRGEGGTVVLEADQGPNKEGHRGLLGGALWVGVGVMQFCAVLGLVKS